MDGAPPPIAASPASGATFIPILNDNDGALNEVPSIVTRTGSYTNLKLDLGNLQGDVQRDGVEE